MQNVKYKNWPAEIWAKVQSATELALRSGGPAVAAFDADGTLWDTDLGESFFRYQIEQNLLPEVLGPIADPWKHYRDMKLVGGDPRAAYLWLAQINAGRPLSQIHAWAEACVASCELTIFAEQKRLIEYFLSKGVRVFVVTASVSWAVEPGALRFGLRREDVLGVRTEVRDGEITARGVEPLTYREGKLQALLAATDGVRPFFASGNTMGDFALLSGAGLALAVGAAQPGQELFATEEQLRGEARARGWLIHRF